MKERVIKYAQFWTDGQRWFASVLDSPNFYDITKPVYKVSLPVPDELQVREIPNVEIKRV